MSPRFVLERENVLCVAEVVNRSLKADSTDFTYLNEENSLSRKPFTSCKLFFLKILLDIVLQASVS